MVHHLRHVIVIAAALLALLPSIADAGRLPPVPPNRTPPPPPPPPRVDSTMIAPQIKTLQDLSDPVIISILPPQVVDRSALNRRPSQPNLVILGPGGVAPLGPTGFINGMPPRGETRFRVDEFLAFARVELTPQIIARLAAMGFSLLEQHTFGLLGVTVYKFHIDNSSVMVPQAIGTVVAAFPAFWLVQPNYVFVPAQDPAPASRGGATQEGDAAQYIREKFRLIDAHRIARGANVPIAVIDSEIDAAHPDLAGVIAQRLSATGTQERPHSHGTGMAGAIASHQRLIGVAPGARLLAVSAFSTGATTESTTFYIVKGLDWAVKEGARVVNMSFAGPHDPALERAFKAAYDKGVVLIAAAGNAGPRAKPLYPGADPSVIAVTATDADDKLFAGANRGRYIAVAAPGVDILVPAPDAGYQLTTGTSVAAAEVSGVVALLLERNPRLKPADIRRILTGSARRLGQGQRDDNFGSGLVDPLGALSVADPRTAGTPPPRR